MPGAAQRAGGLLQAVGARNDPLQFFGAALNIAQNQPSQLCRLAEQLVELRDLGRALVDVRDQQPIRALTGAKLQFALDEIRAALGANVRLRSQRLALPEEVQLDRGKQRQLCASGRRTMRRWCAALRRVRGGPRESR